MWEIFGSVVPLAMFLGTDTNNTKMFQKIIFCNFLGASLIMVGGMVDFVFHSGHIVIHTDNCLEISRI